MVNFSFVDIHHIQTEYSQIFVYYVKTIFKTLIVEPFSAERRAIVAVSERELSMTEFWTILVQFYMWCSQTSYFSLKLLSHSFYAKRLAYFQVSLFLEIPDRRKRKLMWVRPKQNAYLILESTFLYLPSDRRPFC